MGTAKIGENMQRENKVKGWIRDHKAITAVLIAVVMIGATTGAVMFLSHSSVTKITTQEATISFSTTVTGVATNANLTPLAIDGTYYNATNIASFSSSQGGTGAHNSTVSMTTSNFVNGDYVEFNVSMKNTGTATLYLNTSLNNVSIVNYFINPDGTQNGTGNGNTSGPIAIMLDYTDLASFQSNLATENNWYNTVGVGTNNSSLVNTMPAIPHELKSGQSFSYLLFIGLGTNAPYPINGELFSISIPLIPAR